jgi:electron transport complex protein RnfC
MEINKISKGIIAVKESNYGLIGILQEYIGTYPNISIAVVRNVYPMGWERLLIKEILDVDYEKIPSEKGIVVNNISTIYAIYKALKYHKPISKRVVTITGEMIKKPQNVIVKLGTPISKVIEEIGGYKEETKIRFIAGGPMMGVAVPTDELIVTKNLNSVVVINGDEEIEPITCLRCGRCSYVCPAKISPVLIRDKVGDFESLKYLQPERCIECGLCSYICPSKIDVREAVKEAKKEIRRH